MSIPIEFLVKSKISAIVKIENLKDRKAYLFITDDAVSSYKTERFKLDMGSHENGLLQKEYEEIGLESFSIDILRKIEDGENAESILKKEKEKLLEAGFTLY